MPGEKDYRVNPREQSLVGFNQPMVLPHLAALTLGPSVGTTPPKWKRYVGEQSQVDLGTTTAVEMACNHRWYSADQQQKSVRCTHSLSSVHDWSVSV